MRQWSVTVRPEVDAGVRAAAVAENRSVSNLIDHVMSNWLARRATSVRVGASIERFVAELGERLGHDVGAKFAEAFKELDIEGDTNPDATAFMLAVSWVAARRDHDPIERLMMIHRLRSLRGRNVVDLLQFTGWQP